MTEMAPKITGITGPKDGKSSSHSFPLGFESTPSDELMKQMRQGPTRMVAMAQSKSKYPDKVLRWSEHRRVEYVSQAECQIDPTCGEKGGQYPFVAARGGFNHPLKAI